MIFNVPFLLAFFLFVTNFELQIQASCQPRDTFFKTPHLLAIAGSYCTIFDFRELLSVNTFTHKDCVQQTLLSRYLENDAKYFNEAEITAKEFFSLFKSIMCAKYNSLASMEVFKTGDSFKIRGRGEKLFQAVGHENCTQFLENVVFLENGEMRLSLTPTFSQYINKTNDIVYLISSTVSFLFTQHRKFKKSKGGSQKTYMLSGVRTDGRGMSFIYSFLPHGSEESRFQPITNNYAFEEAPEEKCKRLGKKTSQDCRGYDHCVIDIQQQIPFKTALYILSKAGKVPERPMEETRRNEKRRFNACPCFKKKKKPSMTKK